MTSRRGIPNKLTIKSIKMHDIKPLMDTWEWQAQGNCVGEDPEIFFLAENSRMGPKAKAINRAKEVCFGCPVKQQCLEQALAVPEEFGVWGGTTPEERAKISTIKDTVLTISKVK